MGSGSIKQSRGHRASQFAKGQNTEVVATSCLASRVSLSFLLRWGWGAGLQDPKLGASVLAHGELPFPKKGLTVLWWGAKLWVPFRVHWGIPLSLLFLLVIIVLWVSCYNPGPALQVVVAQLGHWLHVNTGKPRNGASILCCLGLVEFFVVFFVCFDWWREEAGCMGHGILVYLLFEKVGISFAKVEGKVLSTTRSYWMTKPNFLNKKVKYLKSSIHFFFLPWPIWK